MSDTIDLTAIKAIRRVLDAWWGERHKVDPNQLAAPFRITNEDGSNAWGHFSQLAVWSLRGVGCGAVIHGTESAKLLLVCDFSHTNMLGQKTLKPGPLAPCPYNTVRKADSPYFLLCTNVRHITSVDDSYSVYRDILPSTTESSLENYDADEVPKIVKVHEKHVTEERRSHDDKYKLNDSLEASEEGITSTGKTTGICTEDEDSEEVTDDDIILVRGDDVETHAVQPRRTSHTIQTSPEYDGETTSSKSLSSKRTTGNVQLRKPNEGAVLQKPIYKDTAEQRRHRLEKNHGTVDQNIAHHLFQEQHQHHKWHHTRSRHERPGAKALLLTTVPVVQTTRRWSSVKVTLMLDKEDIEQLFRDTGFSIKWKNNYYN